MPMGSLNCKLPVTSTLSKPSILYISLQAWFSARFFTEVASGFCLLSPMYAQVNAFRGDA